MKKPSLLIIFLTVFIDLVGFGIVLPLLPQYAKIYGAEGIKIGMVIGSYSLMQFMFAPMWGRLSDRIGRRPVLLLSNFGSATAYALFALSAHWTGTQGLLVLLFSRMFAGVCGANLSVASAYIADITTPENRSRGMGMIGMAFGFGFILGPALGSFSAGHFGLSGPGWVAAGICFANFLLGCAILVESKTPGSPGVQRPKLEQWKHTMSQPRLGLLICVFFLATFCFTCFESTLPLLLEGRPFKWFGVEKVINKGNIGYLFAYCGLMGAFIQGGAIGKMVKRFGETQLIAGSLVVVAVSLVLIPYAPGLAGLLIGLGLFAAGSGINRAPTMGLISQFAPPNEQGATLGVAQSVGTLARVVGPPFATWTFAMKGSLPYLICAGIAALTGLFAWQKLHKAVTPANPGLKPAQ